MKKLNKWVHEIFQDEIAEITGFKASRINLILSKRTKEYDKMNYHKFEYAGERYVLVDKELKCLKK